MRMIMPLSESRCGLKKWMDDMNSRVELSVAEIFRIERFTTNLRSGSDDCAFSV